MKLCALIDLRPINRQLEGQCATDRGSYESTASSPATSGINYCHGWVFFRLGLEIDERPDRGQLTRFESLTQVKRVLKTIIWHFISCVYSTLHSDNVASLLP